MHLEQTQLKKFIVGSGLVSNQDIHNAEEEALAKKLSLGTVLVNHGKLGPEDLRRLEARAAGMPFIDLKNEHIDPNALRIIPEPTARKHNIVAFKKTALGLEVALLDLADLHVIDFLKKKLDMKILPRLTDTDSIKSALIKYQKSLKSEFGDLLKKESGAAETFEKILKHALVQHVSDIHIESQEKDLLVRYRIDGVLHDAMVLPKSLAASIVARIKGLASLSLDENRFPQDGRFKIDMNGEVIALRVSLVPAFHGERAVISIVRDNSSGFTLEQLGFRGDNLERVRQALKAKTGLILVAGSHDSGLSTTLQTIAHILNTPEVNISAIEEKVHYQIPRVNQIEAREDIGFSVSQGLRSLLRQDSDVIIVDSVRDAETMSLALQAVVSGRLVIAALPAKASSSAITQMLAMKIDSFLVGSVTSLIVGQRLARRLAKGHDRKALSRAELGALGKVVDLDRMLDLLRREKIIGQKEGWGQVLFGSPKVSLGNKGYEGSVGIQETLNVSGTIQALIMKGATAGEIENRARKEGMITMIEDGICKAAQGMTTIEEVLRVVLE